MAEYVNTQPNITLSSAWNCHTSNLGGGAFAYKIVRGPTASSGVVAFPVSIPNGAYVKRVWITVGPNTPLSGAAYKMVDGHYIPPSNTVDLKTDLFVPSMTVFQAAFGFKANGIVYEDYAEHVSYWTVIEPTLHIEYYMDESDIPDIDIIEDTSNTSDNDPSDGRFFMPRLLDYNMDEKARLRPSGVSLELNIAPLSTAHMRLPPDQPTVMVRDFVELFAPPGSVGLFRVSEAQMTRGMNGGQDVYLEHAFTTLADSLASGVNAMSGPVAQVVATLLHAQDEIHWVLGDCDVPVDTEMVYEYTDDNLLKALMTVLELLPEEYVLEFNTRVHPFVLHIRKVDEEAFCEARLSRNMTSVRQTIDSRELCTRVTPFGAGEGTDRITLEGLTGQEYMDADTMDTWGVVARTFINEDIYDAISLQEVATRYLERHKNPANSISIDGYDLYAATGEELDRFRMGRMCRVAMPDFGITMYDRVVSKNYPDVYNKPTKVTVTLASKIRNVGDEIAALFREVTHSKLLGGTVKAEEKTSSTAGVYVEDPYAMFFDVKEYGTMIACRLTYDCRKSGTAESVSCRIYVDGVQIPQNEDKGGVVDVLKYLNKDANGIPVVGQHEISLSPMGNIGVEHYVSTRLLIKTVTRGSSVEAPEDEKEQS